MGGNCGHGDSGGGGDAPEPSSTRPFCPPPGRHRKSSKRRAARWPAICLLIFLSLGDCEKAIGIRPAAHSGEFLRPEVGKTVHRFGYVSLTKCIMGGLYIK